jgi:penicillin G amidase
MTPRRRRWLRGTATALGSLLLLVCLAFLGLFVWLRQSLPQVSGTIDVAGLSRPVEIRRDRDGIVTIRAASENDAYFALGFVHAQDRLLQMDLTRRLGAGRLSEIIGPAAVSTDIVMRTLGLYHLAEDQLGALPAELQAVADAYCAGVNAFLDQGGVLPLEFALLRYRPEDWRPADTLVWGRLMAWQLSGNWRDEVLRRQIAAVLTPDQLALLWPALPGPSSQAALPSPAQPSAAQTQLAALPDLPFLPRLPGESNNWVVAGSHTASGKPLLANDPHLGLQTPSQWYLVRIETPGLTLVGATAPGVPFLIIGHNGRVGWGFTTTQSDTQDLFIEKLLPGDPRRYQTPDGPSLFESHDETIAVRGEAARTIAVRSTGHGVVVSGTDLARGLALGADEVAALAWPALKPDDPTPLALWRMNHAKDAGELRGALVDFHAPQQNVVFADRGGEIGFVAAGLVPKRRALYAGSQMPAPGWSGDYDWTGFVDFAQLPQEKDPPRGWIATANNKIVGSDYPYFLAARWEAAFRIRRIRELLGERTGLTADDMAKIQLDDLSLTARDLLPAMLDAVAGESDPRAASAVAVLRGWNLAMSRDQPAPLIFAAWLGFLHRAIFAGRLGPLYPDFAWHEAEDLSRVLLGAPPPLAGWCDDPRTPSVEDCPARIRAAFAETLAELQQAYGADVAGWRWGTAHQAALPNRVLAGVPVIGRWLDPAIATDGADDTVNRATYPGDQAGRFPVVHGPGLRMILDFADLDRSRFIIAGGQSGNPLSPHYHDQVERWRDGRFLTIVGDGDELLTLRPKPPSD